MPEYAILANPGHNRVYFIESQKLSVKELELAGPYLDAGISNVRVESVCGVWYVMCKSEREVSAADLARLGEMSFAYAAFEKRGELFRPLQLEAPGYMNGDVNTILKYGGKTNEIFTRLMVNMALYASDFAKKPERLTLLDPLCGRGTTLFEGLMRGYDVIGIEALPNSTREAEVFLSRYLKENRFIHRISHEKRSDEKGRKIAECERIKLAPTREAFESEPHGFTLFTADTRLAGQLCKKAQAHLIVADLPYGVQHGSRTSAKLMRDPLELLEEAVPVWMEVLKKGGAMALAYNVNVTPEKKIRALLEGFGLDVRKSDMTHRVDQSILRDVAIAALK